jgi:Rnl2 family RNA ligase
MQYKKYNDIENLRQKFINQIFGHGHSEDQYVVQEKIHGANFCFITDGHDVKCTTRNRMLTDDDSFYSYEMIFDDVKEKVIKLFHIIRKDHEDLKTIHVYGELFGGSYGHPDVKPYPTVSQVQRGIDYSPKNEFCAFDIVKNSLGYLDIDYINSAFEEVDLLHSQTLKHGRLEECMEYPNEFQTTIPSILGYPQIENNFCEGTVIKPVKTRYLGNGCRVIMKNKNSKWSERSGTKKTKVPEKFPEHLEPILEKVSPYITENRLRNVLSKIGQVNDKGFGKLQGLFVKDIMEELARDSEDLTTLTKPEKKHVQRAVNSSAMIMVRENFRDILDNDF